MSVKLKHLLHIIALHAPSKVFHYDLRRPTRCPVMTTLIFLLGLFGLAQAAVIRGNVRSADAGNPLAGVNVSVEGTVWGASTGADGRFEIWGVPAGSWSVEASFLGFATAKREIVLKGDDTLKVDFRLQEQVIPLEEVVYTGTRTNQYLKDTPVATELITGRDIRRRAAVTAAEALETQIGLDVQEDFSGQGVTLQGVDPNKVLVLVDGRRVIGRVNGSIDLNQISTTHIKQIEVVKGAVSTLYGSEAIGGVINIVTAPQVHPLSIGVDFESGGYIPNVDGERITRLGVRSSNWTPSVSVGLKRGAVAALGGIRYRRQGLVDIDPTTNHTEGSDAADRFNGDLRFDYHLNPAHAITISARLMQEEKSWIEDGGYTTIQVSFDDEETNRRRDIALEWNAIGGRSNLTVTLYNTFNNHEWRKFIQPPYRRLKDFSNSREQLNELSLIYTHSLNDLHRLTSGFEYYLWDINSASSLGGIRSDYKSSLNSLSAYTQDEWRALPDLTILPGVRFEHHEAYGPHWSPRISFMWNLVNDLKVRGSLGYGYRAPTSKELYFVFNHTAAGYIVYGNPNLKPEESQNYQLSFEYQYQGNALSCLSFFYNDLRNLIDFDSLTATEEFYTGIYQYRNIVEAWIAGLELERHFRIGGHLEADLAYTYLETRNRAVNAPLVRRPRHSGRWNLTLRRGEWTAKIWGRYTGRMLYNSIWATDDQVSAEWTIPYHIWSVNLTRALSDAWSAHLKVENIFDFNHPRYGPRSGRTVSLGMRWSYLRN